MDEIRKEQILSAIYLAISNGNYRCAQTIFDMTTMKMINDTLEQTIELIERYEYQQLIEKVRQLKVHNLA
jgi:hypothetical protein